jgi:hypothetical protein
MTAMERDRLRPLLAVNRLIVHRSSGLLGNHKHATEHGRDGCVHLLDVSSHHRHIFTRLSRQFLGCGQQAGIGTDRRLNQSSVSSYACTIKPAAINNGR